MVTELLEKAIAVASELLAEEQDALAALVLAELAAEKRWDEALARNPSKLRRLAAEALEEIRAGRAKKLNVDEL